MTRPSWLGAHAFRSRGIGEDAFGSDVLDRIAAGVDSAVKAKELPISKVPPDINALDTILSMKMACCSSGLRV